MKLTSRTLAIVLVLSFFSINAISDQEEKDSDMDGIPDEWELRYDLDPKDPKDACFDSFFIGFTNLELYKAGSTPDRPDGYYPVGYKEFGITNSCHVWTDNEQIDYLDKVAGEERFRVAIDYRWTPDKTTIPLSVYKYLTPIYKEALQAKVTNGELPKHHVLVAIRLLHKINPEEFPVASFFGDKNKKLNYVVSLSLGEVYLPDGEIKMLIGHFNDYELDDQISAVYVLSRNNSPRVHEFFASKQFRAFMENLKENRPGDWESCKKRVMKYPPKMNDLARKKMDYFMRRYKLDNTSRAVSR